MWNMHIWVGSGGAYTRVTSLAQARTGRMTPGSLQILMVLFMPP